MAATCKIRGTRKLGLRMQDWHGSMGDPIYAVGSHWFAGRPVGCDVAERALSELERLRLNYMVLKGKRKVTREGRALEASNRRSLEILIRALRTRLAKKR